MSIILKYIILFLFKLNLQQIQYEATNLLINIQTVRLIYYETLRLNIIKTIQFFISPHDFHFHNFLKYNSKNKYIHFKIICFKK